MLEEQRDRLVVHEGPVLDRMHTGADGPLHPLRAVGVGRHVKAIVLCGLDDRGEFIVCELGVLPVAGGAQDSPVAVILIRSLPSL